MAFKARGWVAVCEAGITNRGLYTNKAVDNTKIKNGEKGRIDPSSPEAEEAKANQHPEAKNTIAAGSPCRRHRLKLDSKHLNIQLRKRVAEVEALLVEAQFNYDQMMGNEEQKEESGLKEELQTETNKIEKG